ncbi:hypothetical protein NL418_010385 [Escherichia coli]|nr:hypothetical protein [Escherichia coli]WCQ56165.1 hypothetical protein NL418_010385 [Escherichia coli]
MLQTTSGPDVNCPDPSERTLLRNPAWIPAPARREEVDMVVAGQQRSWIDCCITQPR